MLKPTLSVTMPPQAPALDGFLALAQEYCEENDLGAGFQKEVRGFFLKSISRSYWESIRRFMAGTAWPVAKACKAAGVNPSTHTRWDEMTPTFETICLLFARCDLEMKNVEFPSGHVALRSAVLKTIEHIRCTYLGCSPARLDDEIFECLRQVLINPAVLKVLRDVEKPPPEGTPEEDAANLLEEFGRAADSIASALSHKFPGGRIHSRGAVQQAIDDWLIPWVLLYGALPPAQRGC